MLAALRLALRLAVLLLLAAAAVTLVALSGEYPGETAAGRRVAIRDALPLVLLAWAHVGLLDAAPARASFRWWAAIAMVGDVALLALGLAQARHGGAPLVLALPVIAALLLVGTVAIAWRGRAP